MKPFSKGFRYILILCLLLSLPLVGCSTPSNVLKIALDIEDEGRYDDLFDYYKNQTGYTVKATYGEDISKLIGTQNEPDIIKTSTVVVSSMRDSLINLSPLIEADPTIDASDYLDVVMEPLTIGGKIYALPTSINTSLLYYNKSLFDADAPRLREALGLSIDDSVYPQADWTYQDYQTAGVVLSHYTENSGKRLYSQFGAETQLNWWGEWLVYVNQMGGSFYKENSNYHMCNVDSNEAIAATNFFVQKAMGDSTVKFAPNAIEMAASFSFLGGNVAMIFGGHMGDWYSYDALNLKWDIQLLPTPVGRPNAIGGEISADAFGISVRSKKVNQAFSFLKLWTGPEGAKQMYRYGKVGALKQMENLIASLPEKDKKDIDISVVFNAVKRAQTLPPEKDFSKVMREMVMTELYKLMYVGRGSETDIPVVLSRIKTNVDRYYSELYKSGK